MKEDASKQEIELVIDDTKLQAAFSELDLYIVDLPDDVRKLLVDLIKIPSKIFCFKNNPTPGARITTLLEPTELFSDFLAACRAGEFKNIVVKGNSHSLNHLHGAVK